MRGGNLSSQISSSDEEVEKTINERVAINTPNEVDSVPNILAQRNEEVLDFPKVDECKTLFEEDVDENDEIWMVSAPLELNPSVVSNLSLNFDSSISKLKCKVNNAKTQFKVYTMMNPSNVNLLLPSRRSKSFRLKTLPASGKIILQKSSRIGVDKK